MVDMKHLILLEKWIDVVSLCSTGGFDADAYRDSRFIVRLEPPNAQTLNLTP